MTENNIVGAKIKVVGVGGGGGNMINHMIREGISGIEMIAINTDAQALEKSLANTKLQLGDGLGAGMKPEVGARAAEKSYDEIKAILEGADMVFVATGLGGGTGTGAAPIVAKAAKEVGALTICIVTRPFFFEGKKRDKLAQQGMEELKNASDSMVVIQNDKLLSIVDKNLGYKDSFKLVDDVLTRAVGGMSSVVLSCGESDINADFADIRTIMEHKGMAILSIGEAVGDDAAVEAIKNAIESPLLDNMSIKGAMGVLIHFTINPNFPLTQIQSAMDIIYENAHEDADIIFGTTSSENLAENEVKITLIATGFDDGKKPKVAQTPKTITSTQPKVETTPQQPAQTQSTTAPKPEPQVIQTNNTSPFDHYREMKNRYLSTSGSNSNEINKPKSPHDLLKELQTKLTGNGGYTIENIDDLDIPTFIRNQMD